MNYSYSIYLNEDVDDIKLDFHHSKHNINRLVSTYENAAENGELPTAEEVEAFKAALSRIGEANLITRITGEITELDINSSDLEEVIGDAKDEVAENELELITYNLNSELNKNDLNIHRLEKFCVGLQKEPLNKKQLSELNDLLRLIKTTLNKAN